MLSSVHCILQDLSGFDDNIKAVHGTPSKRGVSFGHSISMPVPRNRADGQPPPRWALSRSATGIATPSEGLPSSRPTPTVQVDSCSAFNGFPTMQCVEVGRPCFHEPSTPISSQVCCQVSLIQMLRRGAPIKVPELGRRWLDIAGALLRYVCPDRCSQRTIASEIYCASCPDTWKVSTACRRIS